MEKLKIGRLILLVATIAIGVKCRCNLTTFCAKTERQSINVHFKPYDYCTVDIIPSSSWHYLEISWSTSNFDVKGSMPYCHDEYIEVFLTR